MDINAEIEIVIRNLTNVCVKTKFVRKKNRTVKIRTDEIVVRKRVHTWSFMHTYAFSVNSRRKKCRRKCLSDVKLEQN
jgi:hypothetical protein